jgi:hypothetical protein
VRALRPTVPRRLKAVTIHGRFQPPLHVNHWNYAKAGFDRAGHEKILITNPFPKTAPEAHDASATCPPCIK